MSAASKDQSEGVDPSVTKGWACPRCARVFARTGQRHVCGHWTVEGHLAGQSPEAVALFDRFTAGIRRCGPFEFAPVRHQVGFRVRRIFAGVRLTRSGLSGYVDLQRRVDDARFRNVEPYTRRLFVHSFTITALDALDAAFDGYLREAYAVGEGRHLDAKLP